jgi:hypothetical protein
MAAPPIPPIGSIIAYAGLMMGPNALDPKRIDTSVWEHYHPGWMHCDGRQLQRNNYPELEAAIGTAWGGDANWMHLPDLQGYFLRGVEPDRDQPVDQDRNARTSNPHLDPNVAPLRVGPRVGSYESHATALPNLQAASANVTPELLISHAGAHKHKLKFQLNARRAVNSDAGNTVAYPDPNPNDVPVGLAGEHNHVIYGGNLETRPVNAYVHWIIRCYTPI